MTPVSRERPPPGEARAGEPAPPVAALDRERAPRAARLELYEDALVVTIPQAAVSVASLSTRLEREFAAVSTVHAPFGTRHYVRLHPALGYVIRVVPISARPRTLVVALAPYSPLARIVDRVAMLLAGAAAIACVVAAIVLGVTEPQVPAEWVIFATPFAALFLYLGISLLGGLVRGGVERGLPALDDARVLAFADRLAAALSS